MIGFFSVLGEIYVLPSFFFKDTFTVKGFVPVLTPSSCTEPKGTVKAHKYIKVLRFDQVDMAFELALSFFWP